MFLLLGVLYLGVGRLVWYGKYYGSPHESRSISSIFCPLYSCPFTVSWLLVSLPLTETVNPAVNLRAPKFSLVFELVSETGLN